MRILRVPPSPTALIETLVAHTAGPTWESAKTQAECLDYLFEIAVKMLQNGLKLEGEDLDY